MSSQPAPAVSYLTSTPTQLAISTILASTNPMAGHTMPVPRIVVRIPFPANVDPSWRMELQDRENPHSTGLHVGACLDKQRQYPAYSRMSATICDRIPGGHSIQVITNDDLQWATRSVFPGEQISLSNHDDAAQIPERCWGDIVWFMIDAQSKWWMNTVAPVPPRHWGNGNLHAAWLVWSQQPYPDKLWYVAIRRTLPDESRGIPAYYFPEAELRFY